MRRRRRRRQRRRIGNGSAGFGVGAARTERAARTHIELGRVDEATAASSSVWTGRAAAALEYSYRAARLGAPHSSTPPSTGISHPGPHHAGHDLHRPRPPGQRLTAGLARPVPARCHHLWRRHAALLRLHHPARGHQRGPARAVPRGAVGPHHLDRQRHGRHEHVSAGSHGDRVGAGDCRLQTADLSQARRGYKSR